MCSGLKALLEFFDRKTHDAYTLLSRALPGENLNTALGNIKNVSEQRDDSIVRFVLFRRCRHFEHQGVAARAHDRRAPRPRLDLNCEHYALGIFSQHS